MRSAHRARPTHESGGYVEGRRHRGRHAEQGRRRPVPREGALSVARQAARKLLGAARHADGRQGPRLRVHPRSRRRSAGRLRARGPALSLRARVRCGTARTSRRSPTTTARTTSASSSRARSTTCCSTTARRASSSSRTRRPQRHASTTTASWSKDEKGNQIKIDSNSGAMTIEAKGAAQHQGRDDHDRGDRHARSEGERHAHRARLAREHQLRSAWDNLLHASATSPATARRSARGRDARPC